MRVDFSVCLTKGLLQEMGRGGRGGRGVNRELKGRGVGRELKGRGVKCGKGRK